MAFALIEKQQRIWGIDRDTIRGWHCHPLAKLNTHEELEEMSVFEIIEQLGVVLQGLED